MKSPPPSAEDSVQSLKFLLQLIAISIATLVVSLSVVLYFMHSSPPAIDTQAIDSSQWQQPSLATLGKSPHDSLILYGRELVVHTALYIGPKGKVKPLSNGMNCQNCHLEAGTKLYGNNYSMVAATYPKYRERSGTIESVSKRVNDCIVRSLNGTAIDTSSHEMQALTAYILWLGKDVKKGQKVAGAGISTLSYLPRAASAIEGKTIYAQKCQSCHGANGEGVLNTEKIEYEYPPIWGVHSYNIGAGLYRLSRIAGYVKSNMPFGTTYDKPILSDAQAWDVAAYINAMPRPTMDIRHDWPRTAAKPIDHPYGPYSDTFSEMHHKYGPYIGMTLSK